MVGLCLLVAASSGAGTALSGTDADSLSGRAAVAQSAGGESLYQSTTVATEHNETDRHQNPEEYNEEGDDDGIESWLEGQLAGQLEESAIQIDQGEYDRARDAVGDKYDDQLGQYVDVAGETDNGDNGTDERFHEARENQQRLVEILEEYEQTRAEYNEAVEAGDVERARELARRLNELAAELDAVTVELDELYGEIEATTDSNLDEAEEVVQEVRNKTQVEVADVQSSEFTETNIQVSPVSDHIVFYDPLRTTGRLTTEDGEPIANESIQLTVGNQVIETETNATGEFTFSYRPATIPRDTESLSVQYVPSTQSVYLGSETNVSVTVEQAYPHIANLSTPSGLAYNDTVSVSGELLVTDIPVDDGTIQVLVAGQSLGRTKLTNGTFERTVEIPASIPDGEHILEVRLPEQERAVAGTSEVRTVTVHETETRLSTNVTRIGSNELEVFGVLETADGTALTGEQIVLRIDGSTGTTVTTGDDGTFVGTVMASEPLSDGTVRVQAVYRGANSNLAGAESETVVGDGSTDWTLADTAVVGTGALLVVGGTVILVLLWWIRRHEPDGPPLSEYPVAGRLGRMLYQLAGLPKGESSAVAGETPLSGTEQESPSTITPMLERADDQLQSGHPNDAVQACYSAVRQAFEARGGDSSPLTHWEFYQRYRAQIEADGLADSLSTDAFREITETYERATFSDDGVSADTAQQALEHARQLCGVEPGSSDASTVADD